MADQVTAEELAEYQDDYAAAHLRGRCTIERRPLNAPQNASNKAYEVIAEDEPCAIANSGRRNGMMGDPFGSIFNRGSGLDNKQRRLMAFRPSADIQVGDRVTLNGERNMVNELAMPGSDSSLGLCILADVDRIGKPETAEP